MTVSKHTIAGTLRSRETLTTWGYVLLWMALIFFLSAQQTLGELEGPPWVQALRKCGHVVEYTVLGLLLGRALMVAWTTWGQTWSRPLMLSAWRWGVLVATAYAATDEFHQTFVPKRHGAVWDVLVDALSATAALGIWYIARIRRPASPRVRIAEPEHT